MSVKEQTLNLHNLLANYTREGALYEKLENNKLRCYACGHRCLILDGHAGVCKVRFNEDGVLKVPYGYVAGMNCDPIEKKPFFHAMPGTNAMSFGMLGCDYHCSFCQNWLTSQALRDPQAGADVSPISADEIVSLAERYGASTVTSTYNEPLITSEWAVEVFKLAKERGLHTSYVSNGNGTPEVIEYLRPWTDMYKIDLKSFRDKSYRQMGGKLQTVLDTIQFVYEKGFWMELVTLVVPEMNDTEEEMREMAQFVASIDKNIPWHVTAFHEDYKMRGKGNTRIPTLLKAGELGKEAGLNFVYVGNVHGVAPEWENTCCPECGETLIERYGFRVRENKMRNGSCPRCHHTIPGVWN